MQIFLGVGDLVPRKCSGQQAKNFHFLNIANYRSDFTRMENFKNFEVPREKEEEKMGLISVLYFAIR